MQDKVNEFLDNSRDNGISMINSKPELQLKIIQHFMPQAELNKSFKTHEEKTPSSRLKLDGTKYWLKNFGASIKAADWLNITQEHLGCDVIEALRYISQNIVSLNGTSAKKPDSYSSFEKRLYAIKNNEITQARKYLKGRSIEVEKLPDCCFYQSKKQDGTYEIVFIDSEERLLNLRALNNDKGNYYNNGKLNNTIYDKLYKPEEDRVFLTEGCINALSIYEHSVLAFFSAGNDFTEYNKLKPYIEGKTVVLAFDNDEAGNSFKEKILNLIIDYDLTEEKIYWLKQPLQKDLNKLLKEGKLKNLLEDSSNFDQLYPPIIPNSENIEEDLKANEFYKENNCYWVVNKVRGEQVPKVISTFIMDVMYFFPGENAHLVVNLQNKFGVSKICKIPIDSLELNKFKAYLRKQKGGFSFRGTSQELDSIIEAIHINQNEVEIISVYGHQEKYNFYALANGILAEGKFHKVNRYGIVKLKNKLFYLPPYSKLEPNLKAFRQEQEFCFRNGSFNIEKWSKLFYKAYDKNGMIAIMYTICAIYRDVIIDELGWFPYLYLFGEADSGKTTFSEAMMSLFWRKNKGIGLESLSTTKSIARTAHKYKNSLIYLKEFNQNIDKGIIGLIKTGYEGIAYSTAQKTGDYRTNDAFINSAIILDGNSMPSDSAALLSRMFVLFFIAKNYTEENLEAYFELKKVSKDGFGKVLNDIIKEREFFIQQFPKIFEELFRQFKKDVRYKNVSTRSLNHLSLILAVFKSFKHKSELPFSFDELFKYATKIIFEQNDEIQSINRVNVFWDAVDYLQSDGQLKKGIHYCFTTNLEGERYLALSINRIYSLCKKNVNLFENLPTKNDLLRLLTSDNAFIKSWQKDRNNSVTVKPIGSAYAFDTNKVKLNLELWQK